MSKRPFYTSVRCKRQLSENGQVASSRCGKAKAKVAQERLQERTAFVAAWCVGVAVEAGRKEAGRQQAENGK